MSTLAPRMHEYLKSRLIQNDMYTLVCEQEIGAPYYWFVYYLSQQSGLALLNVQCCNTQDILISVNTAHRCVSYDCHSTDVITEAIDVLQTEFSQPEWLPFLEQEGQPMPAP